jgi:glycosyltransferase involved in cell wall biosynthesis
MKKSAFPFITIAMPVRNEERSIATTLADTLKQDYPPDRFEVIVADGNSADRTREIVEGIARAHPQVILMPNPGLLPSSGRNVGFRYGRGDLFLVIDGHCRINNSHLLRNVVECFDKSGAQCLGRPQPFIIPEQPTTQKAIALARASWLGHCSNSYIHSDKEGFVSPVSVGCAYKREVFQKIGFVDESFDACEDVEFNYRVKKAGFKAFLSPSIAVHYHPRENLHDLWNQLLRYGMGRFKFIFKHPETINFDMFLPLAFVMGVVLGPLFGLIHPSFWWIYASILLLYLTLISIESSRLGLGSGYGFALKLMITFPVIHFGLGAGLLRGAWQRVSQCRLKDPNEARNKSVCKQGTPEP